MSTSPFRARFDSTTGLTLVEVTVAITVFVVTALGVGAALTDGIQHRQQSFQIYQGLNVLRDIVAEVQNTANLPQNLVAQEGIGAIYDVYQGQTRAVPNLPNAQVVITCFPSEASVPLELGGPQDLNFDGDAVDDLGNISNGSDLKIVPMMFTLTMGTGKTSQTITFHRLITKTTD